MFRSVTFPFVAGSGSARECETSRCLRTIRASEMPSTRGKTFGLESRQQSATSTRFRRSFRAFGLWTPVLKRCRSFARPIEPYDPGAARQ